ncbi:hypothetical protein Q3G72_031671 [Acer saccharum]|nr:hypothetical protein Q3G72_031671 [Acer saccharum]
MGLGPLEENDTTLGAMTSFQVSPARIVAIGFLKKSKISTPSSVVINVAGNGEAVSCNLRISSGRVVGCISSPDQGI